MKKGGPMEILSRNSGFFGSAILPALLLGGLLGACANVVSPGDLCDSGQTRCLNNVCQNCQGGFFTNYSTCTKDQVCADGLGCAACTPNSGVCKGQEVHQCTAQGTVNPIPQK